MGLALCKPSSLHLALSANVVNFLVIKADREVHNTKMDVLLFLWPELKDPFLLIF